MVIFRGREKESNVVSETLILRRRTSSLTIVRFLSGPLLSNFTFRNIQHEGRINAYDVAAPVALLKAVRSSN